MKKFILLSLLLLSSTLYPFFDELEDIIDDSSLFQIVGIITMIVIIIFFIKKFINRDYEHNKTQQKYNIEEKDEE